MRAVVQRVTQASVSVEGAIVGSIEQGLLVYLGILADDQKEDFDYIASKVLNLRIFDDEKEIPNLSVMDIQGSILLVSQFTLCGDARHGRRPGYSSAARPENAKVVYDEMVNALREKVPVETGVFQANMQVSSINDGPFTILLDSRRLF